MRLSKTFRVLAGSALMAALLPSPAAARLTKIVIQTRAPAPHMAGVADYEILHGYFEGKLDPRDPHNAIITDLEYAPHDAQGLVSYSATFAIALPIDPAQGSGVLFYDVPNRGVDSVGPDPDGHIRVISGWQGDIPPMHILQTATVPVAAGPHDRPITGPVLARFVDVAAGTQSVPITGGIGLTVPRPQPVTLDTSKAVLMRENHDGTARIAPGDWAFADCSAAAFPGKPDGAHLCLRNGFAADSAYTLVYQARDPKVLGIGFAATRDLIAFLRHAKADDAGTPNPVAGEVKHTVASGTSQSGNFLRSFLNLGFNADEQGRIVFDGMNPNIAARHVPLNIRFGVPGGAADRFEPGSEGTLWWGRYDDKVRGRGVSSLLDRCHASGTCPKIIETFGSSEFWGLRMSPDLVGTDARADIPLPANVRRYYFPGVTHGGAGGYGFSMAYGRSLEKGARCELADNPNPSISTLHALQKALVAWVLGKKDPPPSVYPTIAAGDLVAPNARSMGWPAIPGAPTPTGKLNTMVDYDFGSKFHYRDESGIITLQPPHTKRAIPSLVSRVNSDGNETSGVASVQLLVPLGTYTGWNVRASGFDQGRGCGFEGGYIPFAVTRAERLASGDPRPSLEERYGSHQGFVDRVRSAVGQRVAAGWLLEDDGKAIIAAAEASDVLR